MTKPKSTFDKIMKDPKRKKRFDKGYKKFMKKEKSKTIKAWIIIEHLAPAVYDHRMPIFWLERIAEQEARKLCLSYEIKQALITIEG